MAFLTLSRSATTLTTHMTRGVTRVAATVLVWLTLGSAAQAQGAGDAALPRVPERRHQPGELRRVRPGRGSGRVFDARHRRYRRRARCIWCRSRPSVSTGADRRLRRTPSARRDTWRAAAKKTSRGLSADVARVLNEVALVKDPGERLRTAERARRSLADWPGSHYGYRAREVHDIIGVLDEVISGLRAAAGLGGYNLELTATTPPPPAEALLPAPEQTEVVQQLMTRGDARRHAGRESLAPADGRRHPRPRGRPAARRVGRDDSHDRAGLDCRRAEDRQRLCAPSRHDADRRHAARRTGRRARPRAAASRRSGTGRQARAPPIRRRHGAQRGHRSHLDSAHRLRLAHDQWVLRASERRAPISARAVPRLSRSHERSGGWTISARWPARRPGVCGRWSTSWRAKPESSPAWIRRPSCRPSTRVLRSACELALNAARLRLSAVEAADLGLAQQASSAAAGSLMLLAKAKADLDAALRPPTLAAAAQ